MTWFQSLIETHGGAGPLICAPQQTLDKAALLDQIARTQTQIAELRPGRRIGLLLPDAPETLILIATLMGQHRVVPLNPHLSSAELQHQIRDARLDGLITGPGITPPQTPLPQRRFDPATGLSGDPIAGANADSPGVVLFTSGSTGAPKRVPLSPQQLETSARTIAATLDLGHQDRALHALPMFHIGALVDLFLAPLLAGGSVRIAPGPGPADLRRALMAGDVTWMQMVPTMLHACLADWSAPEAATLMAPVRFVRSVSSDLAPDVQARAEAHLGGVPLIQMYGMTEAAGQIASNPLPPGLRKPGTVGRPDGAEVAIVSDFGTQLPQGEDGEICIRGPAVTPGYEDHPAADTHHGAWLRSGDLGRIDSDGYLILSGRLKEMINRGGEKIAPVEIERAALAIPGVTEAAAYALPHPTLGEQVGLSVVAAAPLDEAAVLAALAPQLADFKRPRKVQMLDSLPRLGSGKINKHALRQGATAQTAPAWTGEAAVIAEVWQSALNAPPPQAQDDFFDLGGDSLSAVGFLTDLSTRLGRDVPLNLLFEAPRFGDLVDALSQPTQTPADQDPMLTFLRTRTAGWRGQPVGQSGLIHGLGTLSDAPPLFFCGQGQVRDVKGMIDDSRPLYIFPSLWRYPNRTDATQNRLADLLTAEITQLWPHGPVYLAGFCAGMQIIERIADRLLDAGRDVALVVSIDHWFRAPTRYPVLHVFTESRAYSRAMRFCQPELALPLLHPAGAAALRVQGDHGDALRPELFDTLGAEIERWIAAGQLPVQPPRGAPLGPRERAYQARITARGPRWMARDATTPLWVTVRNDSPVPWLPTEDSGLTLVVHLINFDGAKRVRFCGHHRLDSPVAPGGSFDARFDLPYPATALPLMQEIAMVDEGLAEFAPRRRVVWASPLRRG